jgi:hypothetical protein
MTRVKNSAVVARQLPEHIREDYPSFVAFVEAYYEFLQSQGVDFSTIRDIDKTLEDFIIQFKKELAYNLPNANINERFLIQNIKDQYLSKGSPASFKLLFNLLFGKSVELYYPGQSVLRASDGRWNQEVSLFAKVDYGDPGEIIGKVVDIETPNRILRAIVDRQQDVVGEVERIVSLGSGIFEFFLDRNFIGDVNPTDRIKYLDKFQATILPSTQSIKVSQPGKNFRIGQLFEIRSASGTGALIKVTSINSDGGIKHAEIIRFGIGYTADFSLSILPTNSLITTQFPSSLSSTRIEDDDLYINDKLLGFNEQGYINIANYADDNYVDGTYAGTLLREFSLDYRNSNINSDEPAIIEVQLGALMKYPGYYTTNSGFLDDSIYIQDSKYYQAFSYVLRIDERLSSYKSAVKTMLHPAGMALFGEFNIINTFDLSVSLESLVKSLGISLEEDQSIIENISSKDFEKYLDTFTTVFSENTVFNILKQLSSSTIINDVPVISTVKLLNPNHLLNDGINTDSESVSFIDSNTFNVGKSLSTLYSGSTDSIQSFSMGKFLSDLPVINETLGITTDKYLTTTTTGFIENGIVGLNPYAGQDYFSQTYNEITESSTFN